MKLVDDELAVLWTNVRRALAPEEETMTDETTSVAVSEDPDFVWELFPREDLEEGIIEMEETLATIRRALETQSGPIIRKRQDRREPEECQLFFWEMDVAYIRAGNRKLLAHHGFDPDAPEWADCVNPE